MSAQFTQGAWSAEPDRTAPSGRYGIVLDRSFVLAEVFPDIRNESERADDECAANARLMAAAPELLNTLKTLRDVTRAMESENDSEKPTEAEYQEALAAADAAIARIAP